MPWELTSCKAWLGDRFWDPYPCKQLLEQGWKSGVGLAWKATKIPTMGNTQGRSSDCDQECHGECRFARMCTSCWWVIFQPRNLFYSGCNRSMSSSATYGVGRSCSSITSYRGLKFASRWYYIEANFLCYDTGGPTHDPGNVVPKSTIEIEIGWKKHLPLPYPLSQSKNAIVLQPFQMECGTLQTCKTLQAHIK